VPAFCINQDEGWTNIQACKSGVAGQQQIARDRGGIPSGRHRGNRSTRSTSTGKSAFSSAARNRACLGEARRESVSQAWLVRRLVTLASCSDNVSNSSTTRHYLVPVFGARRGGYHSKPERSPGQPQSTAQNSIRTLNASAAVSLRLHSGASLANGADHFSEASTEGRMKAWTTRPNSSVPNRLGGPCQQYRAHGCRETLRHAMFCGVV
jgi:hypothetical protein